MRLSKEDYRKIDKAFTIAYREKEKPGPAEGWANKVMEALQKQKLLPSSLSYWDFLGQLSWAISSVACVFIGLLMVLMLKIDFVPENEIAKVSFDQPIEVSYLEIPGA